MVECTMNNQRLQRLYDEKVSNFLRLPRQDLRMFTTNNYTTRYDCYNAIYD